MRKIKSIFLLLLFSVSLASCGTPVATPLGASESAINQLPDSIGMQNWIVDENVNANQKDGNLFFTGTLYGINPSYCYVYDPSIQEISTLEIPSEYSSTLSFSSMNIINGDLYVVVLENFVESKGYTEYLINLSNPEAMEPLPFEDFPSHSVILEDFVYYTNTDRALKMMNLHTGETTVAVAPTETLVADSFFYDETYVYYQNALQEKKNIVYRFPFGEPSKTEEFLINESTEDYYNIKFIYNGQIYFDTSDYQGSLSARATWQGELDYIFKENFANAPLISNYMPLQDGFLCMMYEYKNSSSYNWIAFYDSDGNHKKNFTQKTPSYINTDTQFDILSYNMISFGNTAIIYLTGPTTDKRQTFSNIWYIDEIQNVHDITITFDD